MATKPKTVKPTTALVKRAPAMEKIEVSTTIRRKELVARVAESSGIKPNVIKGVLDALLQEMGDALSNDETLNLQPFGKMAPKRRRQIDGAEIMICKLRRNKPKPEEAVEDETTAE